MIGFYRVRGAMTFSDKSRFQVCVPFPQILLHSLPTKATRTDTILREFI